MIVPVLDANKIPAPACEHSEGNGNGFSNNSDSVECHPVVIQKEHHLLPNSLHPEPCSLPLPKPNRVPAA